MNSRIVYVPVFCLLFFACCIGGGNGDADDRDPASPASGDKGNNNGPTDSIPEASESLSFSSAGRVFSMDRTDYDKITIYAGHLEQPVLIASRGEKSFVVYGGQELGREYDSVQALVRAGDKVGYMAVEDGKTFVVLDGQEYGRQYDVVRSFRIIDGKAVYLARRNGKDFVVAGGEEIGMEYDSVSDFTVFSGKIAYVAWKNGTPYVVYGGEEINPGYEYIEFPHETGENLTYIGIKNGRTVLYFNGREIASDDGLGDIVNPTYIDGRLAYGVMNRGKISIVYGGQKITNGPAGEELGVVFSGVDGKLAYSVKDPSGKQYVIYDGRKIGLDEGYGSMFPFKAHGDQLIYMGVRGERRFILLDGQAVGDFDPITNPVVIGGKITFAGKKDGVWYIVREQ